MECIRSKQLDHNTQLCIQTSLEPVRDARVEITNSINKKPRVISQYTALNSTTKCTNKNIQLIQQEVQRPDRTQTRTTAQIKRTQQQVKENNICNLLCIH